MLPNFVTTMGRSICDGGSGNGACLDDISEYLSKEDINPNIPGDQTVTTYTIGFTVDLDLLKDTAEKSGGEYYLAEDVQSLTAALTDIVTNIFDRDVSFVAPAVAVNAFNRTQHLNDMYCVEVVGCSLQIDSIQGWAFLVRELHSHHDGGIEFDAPNDAQIHRLGKACHADRLAPALLEESRSGTRRDEEDGQRETQRCQRNPVRGPEERSADRHRRKGRGGTLQLADLFGFIPEVVEQERPDRGEEIGDEDEGVPRLDREGCGCEQHEQADGVQVEEVFALGKIEDLVDHKDDEEVDAGQQHVLRAPERVGRTGHKRDHQENVPDFRRDPRDVGRQPIEPPSCGVEQAYRNRNGCEDHEGPGHFGRKDQAGPTRRDQEQ